MKHNIKTILLLLTLALSFTVNAYDFEVDGIYYNINGNEATVTYKEYSSSNWTYFYSGSVVIPETVTYSNVTYPVTAIGYSAFRLCKNLTSIQIPNSITTIETYAFYDCKGLTSVVIII